MKINMLINKSKYLLLSISILLFTACGGSGSKDGETTPSVQSDDLESTYAYIKNNNYSSVLKKCASATEISESCTLNTLPFLAQENSVPTKEMIMKRVLVSHDWMGDRFSQMIDVLDDDMKILLGAVTAIVIDSDIRPSYYWGLTGAIYLDPRYLWLTPEEAGTITVQDDYRSDYGDDLIFEEFARFVKNGERAYSSYDLDSNETRNIDDIKYQLASLLYHELAHANDYFPSNYRENLDLDSSVVNVLNNIGSDQTTYQLYNIYPLTSTELTNMGSVLYQGTNASETQKQTTAENMGLLFTNDSATSMYAYSSQREDTATLFQMFMIKYHYGIERDIAFTTKPAITPEVRYCEDYVVGWGERNRIANDDVKQRALYVTKRILPNYQNWDEIFNEGFGEATLLSTQVDWCESININTSDEMNTISIKRNTNKEKINSDDIINNLY